MSNLKPCPFCGGEAELCYGPGAINGYRLFASCNECGAKSPGLWQEKKPEPDDQGWKGAADEWNHRPGEEELNKLIEQMREALKRLKEEEEPIGYHDCIADGLDECAWCEAEAALSAAERGVK